MLDKELDDCIGQIYQQAIFNRHEFLTMEHLMLGLLKNSSVVNVLNDVDCDIPLLKSELLQHIEQHIDSLPDDIEVAPQPTTAFQRVMQRAIYSARSAEVPIVSGDRVLVAFFEEPEC
ncbi:MAG TPA: ATP-dependent Clp protease ATP-binding subunit ClpA, partial [Oceanospirillales bacterium]|nr:ATP-dependent Clp protease ATP-binding subunit ClpA [Oceanospirillales bacterium]